MDNRLVSVNTNFGFNLFSTLTKSGLDKNIFISPTSIALSLAMAYNGAAGETGKAMATAMSLGNMTAQDLNESYAAWRAALQKPYSTIDLEIANSVWARQGAQFRPEFLDANKRYYGAEVATLNFSDAARSASVINNWVSNKTHGKIDRIVNDISSDSILFLINAVYFKGKWTSAFDRSQTKPGPFTSLNGTTTQRAMMQQRGDFQYLENGNFQAIALPYGEGDLSLYLFLPAKGTSLSQFLRTLNAANWNEWMNAFENSNGQIVMPRFRVEFEATLNEPLRNLGMRVAFDPQNADFSGILQSSQKPFISEVRHKAYAEVNEEGTEAAAATSTDIQVISAMIPSKTFRMVVDRPFFFAIRDNASGALLFLGSVSDPD